VLQKRTLRPPVAPFCNLMVIGRIQVQEGVRLDWVMGIGGAPLDNFVQYTPCFHRPKAVEFDPVSAGLGLARDLPQRGARPGTRIEHCALRREP